MPKTRWQADAADDTYEAARSYLELLVPEGMAGELVQALRDAPVVEHEAKDVLRASQLALLGREDVKVAEHVAALEEHQPLEPVLLVRGLAISAGHDLVIADGYHRLCAAWWFNAHGSVACKLVGGETPLR
jgi:hypothetical protein